jgi:hypothetical protein
VGPGTPLAEAHGALRGTIRCEPRRAAPPELARLRGVGVPAQQARLDQRPTDVRDFRIADLGEWRSYDGALLAAEQHQRLLHPVMHIDPRLGG